MFYVGFSSDLCSASLTTLFLEKKKKNNLLSVFQKDFYLQKVFVGAKAEIAFQVF